VRIGSELAAFGKKFGGLELNISRAESETEEASFE
jgi:hypothetical protein